MFIRAENVSKQYQDGSWGLKDTSVGLQAGRFTALVGANGAGKSTFIHLLCGLLTPTAGRVEIPEDVSIGWCSQRAIIDWYLNVYDNVMLGARFAGLPAGMAKPATSEALSLVGLKGLAKKSVEDLSGGQQQRVQIARAIVHKPDILILDEPTTGLDIGTSEKLLKELKDRADKGAVVLVSSHDLALLDEYCDDVLFLDRGAVVAFEPRDQFLRRYAGEEVVTVQLDGGLPEDALELLKTVALRVVSVDPVELVVPRGTSLITLLSCLESAQVKDIHRKPAGLREAYVNLTGAVSHD